MLFILVWIEETEFWKLSLTGLVMASFILNLYLELGKGDQVGYAKFWVRLGKLRRNKLVIG